MPAVAHCVVLPPRPSATHTDILVITTDISLYYYNTAFYVLVSLPLIISTQLAQMDFKSYPGKIERLNSWGVGWPEDEIQIGWGGGWQDGLNYNYVGAGIADGCCQ